MGVVSIDDLNLGGGNNAYRLIATYNVADMVFPAYISVGEYDEYLIQCSFFADASGTLTIAVTLDASNYGFINLASVNITNHGWGYHAIVTSERIDGDYRLFAINQGLEANGKSQIIRFNGTNNRSWIQIAKPDGVNLTGGTIKVYVR